MDTARVDFFGISRIFSWHQVCFKKSMLDVLLIVCGLLAACLVTELYSAAAAPLGYQDDDGFHFRPERPVADDSGNGNPS